MPKSSKVARARKSAKPYEGFPLTPHPSGRWCKKIRGRIHYFGKLDDPEAAKVRLDREWPYLSKGETPPEIDTGEGRTVRVLCNKFLTNKAKKLNAGRLSPRSFKDYLATCERLVKTFGKHRRIDDLRPDDFQKLHGKIAQTGGLVRLKNEINRSRIIFKFAVDERLLKEKPHFGQSFDRPSQSSLRIARSESGVKIFTAEEIRRLVEAADPPMAAMVLLGINAGLGNSDCSGLKRSAIDFDSGWLTYPRGKTGIGRRCRLWPETLAALRKAIDCRPAAKDKADDELVFLTKRGVRWVRVQQRRGAEPGDDGKPDPRHAVALDALGQAFTKLMRSLGINGKRGFYNLRHTFETVAGGSKDQVSVDAIMGHVDPSMSAVYRHGIEDARLQDVVDHVHRWLYSAPPKTTAAKRS